MTGLSFGGAGDTLAAGYNFDGCSYGVVTASKSGFDVGTSVQSKIFVKKNSGARVRPK